MTNIRNVIEQSITRLLEDDDFQRELPAEDSEEEAEDEPMDSAGISKSTP